MDPIILASLLLGGGAIFALVNSSEDDAAVPPEPEPEPEPEPDTGSYQGLDDVQDITVRMAGASVVDHFDDGTNQYHMAEDGRFYTFDGETDELVTVDSVPGLLEIEGTALDDSITVSGHDLLVYDSDGEDQVDASGMISGVIEANAGDTIVGSDVAGSQIKVFGSRYTFVGGDAANTAYIGLSGEASGGGGDDSLIADGSGHFSGDEGDDLLIGNYDPFTDSPSSDDSISRMVGDDASQLDGGAGDDVIRFAAGDTVTGGTGSDRLQAFLIPGRDEAVVTDFAPSEDSMMVWVSSAQLDGVTLATDGGDTVIRVGDTEVARIEGQVGLSIGYYQDWGDGRDFGPLTGEEEVHDAAGNLTDGRTVDIVICGYPST